MPAPPEPVFRSQPRSQPPRVRSMPALPRAASASTADVTRRTVPRTRPRRDWQRSGGWAGGFGRNTTVRPCDLDHATPMGSRTSRFQSCHVVDRHPNLCFCVFIRTTIELPDLLLKRAKACAAMRGIKLRRLFAEALERYSIETEHGSSLERRDAGVPAVRAEDLADCKDPAALRAAYPRGYRIVGPLLKADDGANRSPPLGSPRPRKRWIAKK